MSRETEQRPQFLEARVIEQIERQVAMTTVPRSTLETISQHRQWVRDLIAHVNALESHIDAGEVAGE